MGRLFITESGRYNIPRNAVIHAFGGGGGGGGMGVDGNNGGGGGACGEQREMSTWSGEINVVIGLGGRGGEVGKNGANGEPTIVDWDDVRGGAGGISNGNGGFGINSRGDGFGGDGSHHDRVMRNNIRNRNESTVPSYFHNGITPIIGGGGAAGYNGNGADEGMSALPNTGAGGGGGTNIKNNGRGGDGGSGGVIVIW